MIIFASEDIGNANPTALVLANATFGSGKQIGYPEARLSAHAPLTSLLRIRVMPYAAISKKVQYGTKEIHGKPPLCNAPTGLMKNGLWGKTINMHMIIAKAILSNRILPDELKGTTFDEPGATPREEDTKVSRKPLKDKYNY